MSSSKLRTPGSARSPKPADYPTDASFTVSPKLQRLLRKNKSPGSYGCQREVFHPLSPNAEPTALLFYDSEEDTDGEGEQNKTHLSPEVRTALIRQRAKEQARGSPLNPNNEVTGEVEYPNLKGKKLFDTKEGEGSDSSDRVKRKGYSRNAPVNVVPNSSQEHADGTVVDGSAAPPKRYRQSFGAATESPGRVLYGRGLSQEEDEVDKIDDSIPGNFSGHPILEQPELSPKEDLPAETPKKQQPHQQVPSGSPFDRFMTTPRNRRSLSAKSPRNIPLPGSPSAEEIGSGDEYSDDGSDPQDQQLEATTPQRNHAADHAAELADRLNILNIKAEKFSEAMVYRGPDKQYHQQIENIYNSKDRFDPTEAARLETEWQAKLQAVIAKEEERRRREWVAEQARLEEERQARAAEAARIAEEKRRREEEERRKREMEEADRRRKEQEAADARAKADRENADRQAAQRAAAEQARQAKEQADAAAKAAQQQQQQQQQQAAQTAAVPTLAAAPQATSTQQIPDGPLPYTARKTPETDALTTARVIKNLKELRTSCPSDLLKTHAIPSILREIRPKFGQLTGEKQQTLQVREAFRALLRRVQSLPGPTVPSHSFFLTLPQPPPPNTQVPILFIYTLNQIGKIVVKQCLQESGALTRSADPMGIILSSVLSDAEFCIGGKSFIDIIIARLLKHNPILRGELGPVQQSDVAGMRRLGWRQLPSGNWESEEEHASRIQALTAGYVAIAGRDFSKSKMTNPYPMFNLWHKLAWLVNTPPERLTTAHYFAARMMLERGGAKMVRVYGDQAVKLVRCACTLWAEAGLRAGISGAQGLVALGKNWENTGVRWYTGQ